MALATVPSGPEHGMHVSSRSRTTVRPHPSEEDVFILERGEVLSTIYQGVARIGGAVIKYTYEKPHHVVDPVPLLLVPGYGGIKPAYKELRKEVVANGKPAATLRPARTQDRLAAVHPQQFFHPERLLAQSAIGVARDIIRLHGDQEGFDQVDAAGHSMGGPGVVNAATARPQYFRNVIAMASAGLDGHNLIDMAQRAPGVITGELIPSALDIQITKDWRTIMHMGHYVARNPWRTMAEGMAVGSGDIRGKVAALSGKVAGTAALQFANDHFFPEARVREQAADLFDIYRVYPNPDANHMWPQLEPDGVADELFNLTQQL